MRAILVGPAAARDRLRWDLESRSIDVVGEFETIGEARRAALAADIIVLPPLSAEQLNPDATFAETRDQDEDHAFNEPLTPRELQVLELLAEGLPNKAIADRLAISDQTVKFHLASIMGKLGATNRVETVRRAVRRGLVSL